jgi:tetratricopeptide (TPR) repeat protein
MEDNKVIQFKKDAYFYLKKGSDLLFKSPDEKAVQAIDYFFKAKKLSTTERPFWIYFSLAQAYFFVKQLDLSNLYFFMSLRLDGVTGGTYRGLGENFYLQGDTVLARYYLNECLNIGPSKVTESAKVRLNIMDEEEPKFTVIEGGTSSNLETARDYMSQGKFEDAVNAYEQADCSSRQDARSELALAYLFSGETDKSINLLTAHGTDSVADLCSLLLCYHASGDSEKYEQTKQLLRSKTLEDDNDKFKIGLTFVQTGSVKLGLTYMQNFLSKIQNCELEFFYSIALINDHQFERAKRHLITLKKINPLNNYLFNFYLNVCNKQEKISLEYLPTLPLKEQLKVSSKIKNCLVLMPQELKKNFDDNTDFFNYVLQMPSSNTKNLLLLKLAGLSGDNMDEFFDIALLGNFIPTSLKISIAIKRAELDETTAVVLTKDGFYTQIILPNMQVTKINNIHLHSAVLKCVDYMLAELPPLTVSLNEQTIRIERRLKKDNVRDDILACFLSYETLKKFRLTTLTKICRHFKVLQQEFYKFLSDYNFEI